MKEEDLICVVENDVEDDYCYDAATFLEEIRTYKVVGSSDEYKQKKGILVQVGDKYYLPSAQIRKIKEKLNLRIPQKELIELISRYRCGDKSERVAGKTAKCWEFCNLLISDEIIKLRESYTENNNMRV